MAHLSQDIDTVLAYYKLLMLLLTLSVEDCHYPHKNVLAAYKLEDNTTLQEHLAIYQK